MPIYPAHILGDTQEEDTAGSTEMKGRLDQPFTSVHLAWYHHVVTCVPEPEESRIYACMAADDDAARRNEMQKNPREGD